MDVPEWLPDWRDPLQYPDPEKAPLTLFAWEFLRRNPEYQADYDRVWGSLSESERRGVLEEIFPALPGEKEEDYRQRWADSSVTAGAIYSKNHPLGWLRGKWRFYDGLPPWNLGDGLAPAISRPEVAADTAIDEHVAREELGLSFELESSPAISPGGLNYVRLSEHRVVEVLVTGLGRSLESVVTAANEKIDDNDYNTKCSVEIDLLLPIHMQLDRLKKVLDDLQKKAKENGFTVKRPRTAKKLQIYLRVLDAKLSGESNSRIAAVLYPDKLNEYDSGLQASDLVSKDLTAALTYRDHRYRELSLLQKWRKQ